MPEDPLEGERVYSLIDAAEDAWNTPESVQAWQAALAECTLVTSRFNRSAEAHYLRGLCLYQLSTEEFTLQAEALSELTTSLELDPSHQFALFHAIAIRYARGEHAQVLDLSTRISRDYFVERDIYWRHLVVSEYSTCSLFHLDRLDEFRARLPELIDGFVRFEDSLDEILERPHRLIKIYHELRTSGDPLSDYLEGQLARLIPGGWLSRDEL
ncbi:hypothetical protein GCM10009555_028640 [Acrocarpospora macrocephala]|uniref:Tetratricopeptide repeat protein n=1 Tax=Acrocarpospora macrocephala TaxID=150177 RepID=A0A5M3X267_9ACTN|nr:hypothetical protein [Acrocarpospora macrocephala]GES15837.1 hypothetical protein Amac_094350 [Acrocarpospora macrocephala]